MHLKRKSLKSKIFITAIFFGCIQLLYSCLDYLSDKPIFGVLSMEHMLSSDASFNDLFYQMQSEKKDPEKKLSGNTIIINTGSLDKDSFRLQLAEVISNIQEFKPKVIGVDHTFSNTKNIGSDSLFRVVNRSKNIILSSKDNNDIQFDFKLDGYSYGNTDFPSNQISIRRYYSDTNTFAYKVASRLSPKIEPVRHETFFINYISGTDDIFNINSSVDTFLYKFYNVEKFLVLDAKELLLNKDYLNQFLQKIGQDKAFVIGHFGNSLLFDVNNDREDRFRVPCDSNIIERKESMFGVQIHANAIENLLNPNIRFYCWSDSIIFSVVKYMLMFLFTYYLLHVNFGKAFNIIFLSILTFPLIYVILFLMGKYIYLELGLTMLQFLILEEFIESIESIYNYYLKLKSKWVK